ncbi:Ankyrin-2 [Durusdinium trenchii]|uniref:Ankyrin-2 n=1 Tax=Durusdinium trenchii TaxID=1381693 RepID=A0ABP0SN54_9DINO
MSLMSLQDAESKIRKWLETIPIGNGSERGWDDAQIREIATFAEQRQLGHLAPEELYQRYVEHQVAEAEKS